MQQSLAWLLPVALATTNALAITAALMDELRRRRIVAPGLSVVERLIAAVLVVAERHVAGQLTRNLSPAQAEVLDALLAPKEGTPLSVLGWGAAATGCAWPQGSRPHRGAVDLPARRRPQPRLHRRRSSGTAPEAGPRGGRYTAQHLRALSLLRRRATLVATVLDTTARLTDDGVGLFERAVGRMFRRAEAREEDTLLRDARAINDKVRLLVRLGTALIAAKDGDADLDGAVADSVGWSG